MAERGSSSGAPLRVALRVALLAPLVSPIREPFLGGAQALLRDLAVGLAARGHSVTLYAADGSDPHALPGVELVSLPVDPARVRPTDFTRASEARGADAVDPAVVAAFAGAFAAIRANAARHDLLHAHAYDLPAFTGAATAGLPVAHTLHLPAVDAAIGAALGRLAPPGATHSRGAPWLVTVSRACAATYAPFCHLAGVIYNGIAVDAIPFQPSAAQPPYLLYAGRMTPEKGVEDALALARAVGMRLRLVGGVYDGAYFTERIQPTLAAAPDLYEYLGPQLRERVWELMAGAAVVLVPSRWAEPFGLVAAEAQAAGAPVVAYAQGGLPEVIADGETGALVPVGEVAAAAQAVGRALTMSRAMCRARARRLFDIGATLDGYEALYGHMLARAMS